MRSTAPALVCDRAAGRGGRRAFALALLPALSSVTFGSCHTPTLELSSAAPVVMASPTRPRFSSLPDPQTLAPVAPLPAAVAAPSSPVEPVATLPAELVDDGSDDVPELEAPPPPKSAGALLTALAHETWVYAEPRFASRKLGYLRAGSVVSRREEPFEARRRDEPRAGSADDAPRKGKRSATARVGKKATPRPTSSPARPAARGTCSGGWYRVEPAGYVCVGPTQATIDPFHPIADLVKKRPRMDDLPYTYVMSRFPPPPLYTKLPSEAEQREHESELEGHLRKASRLEREPGFVPLPEPEPIPGPLLYGRPAPALGGAARPSTLVSTGSAKTRSGFGLLSTFDHDGRRFGLTTDLSVLPLDRTRVVKPSSFSGLRLEGDETLPVVFVRSRHAARMLREGNAVRRGEPLAHREAIPVERAMVRLGGVDYHVAKKGFLVRADQSVRVNPPDNLPTWAKGSRRWIDVSILKQSLVAYEGEKPVFVTLVSTGADGLGDPKKTHSTIQGTFLIHTKHVSVTMDGDEEKDEFDFRDVPFVQYFTEGYALHAAYWHDEFGTPRSHGCVNLAPKDAAWLFGWTDPKVPEGWHAALSLRRGTLVFTHP
jgi:hypothetical protein